MQLQNSNLQLSNQTLQVLLLELQAECQTVVGLIEQLEHSELTDHQRGEILSDLLVASIHLHTHCDEDWQNLIAEEMQSQ
jgi:hypothetical protein